MVRLFFLKLTIASYNQECADVEERFSEAVLEVRMTSSTQRPPTTPVCAFERQVQRAPNAVAVICEGRGLTYAELHAATERATGALLGIGVERGSRVGVCMSRSPDLLVAMLAIMKAGAAFVPIPPGTPVRRIEYMLETASSEILIVDDEKSCEAFGSAVLYSGLLFSARRPESASTMAASHDVCYILFTSGSTGRPKGVAVQHGALANFFAAMSQLLGPIPQDRFLASTSVGFDVALLEWLFPLTVGSTIVLAPDNHVGFGSRMISLAAASEATIMQATPTVWRHLLNEGPLPPSVRLAISGGEALDARLANLLVAAADCAVWNLYGPTETTVYSAAYELQRKHFVSPPPIGWPILETTLWVLDDQMTPVPAGTPGELYIGGSGLAQGYIGRPELTDEAFVYPTSIGTRLYRTGDRAKELPDGSFTYLGRIGDQIKILGHRIEPGEIEAVFLEQPDISAAAVGVWVGQDDVPRLVGYVVVRDGFVLNSSDLRSRLAQQLPSYMIPGQLVELEILPTTPNGKLDRSALLQPQQFDAPAPQHGASPATTTEETLARIWTEVLQVPHPARDDHFIEAGGHSLLAVSMIMLIEDHFDVSLTLEHILDNPTIGELAEAIDRMTMSRAATQEQ